MGKCLCEYKFLGLRLGVEVEILFVLFVDERKYMYYICECECVGLNGCKYENKIKLVFTAVFF